MCRAGRPEVIYRDRELQAQRNAMMANPQQQQEEHQEEQPLQAVAYEHVKVDSSYAHFLNRMQRVDRNAVAGGRPPEEAKAGWKERKRRKAAYEEAYQKKEKALMEKPRLVEEDELQNMRMFRTKQGREQWENEILPHSKLTRGETVRKIIEEGDYSNFENLDVLTRNRIATKVLDDFSVAYVITKDRTVKDIMDHLKEHAKGVSPFLDPALRLGLSLGRKTEGVHSWQKRIYRELDEAMTTEVMLATLTHVPDEEQVRNYYVGKKSKDPQGDAQKAITANKAQQIQIAKRLLLMQLSNFDKITKDKKGKLSRSAWDSSMAVALSHCSRVALTLPKQDEGASNKEHQQRMWQAIYTINGNNDAQDNRRMSSTHDIERRKVTSKGRVTSKETKVKFNLSGQRGMNCAIGGLGNGGISGKTISNDGSCGHFYSMHKEATAEKYGAMLMGLESDAAGVMNQMGHTHDIFATAEKASSLGGQRTDEEGEKYGGRQCDLTGMSAETITTWLKALENAMLDWQRQGNGMGSADAMDVMKLLAGKKMSAQDWTIMKQRLNLPDAQPTPH